MIGEAFHYLTVRSLITGLSSDDLIGLVEDEGCYQYLISNIVKIMQEENYIFISYALIDNVSELVQHYRFDYNKNKEINDNVNYIIGRLHDYREMSIDRKKYITDNWIKEELEARGIPPKAIRLEQLLNLLILDESYFRKMLNIREEFVIENLMEYLSLVNLLLNKFPKVFEDNLFLEITKQNCECIKSISKLPRLYSKMVQKILSRLKKEYSADTEVEVKVKFYLKKKEDN